MTLKTLIGPVLLLAALPSVAQPGTDLGRYRDKNRVLLIFAPNARDPRWQRQAALFRRSGAQFTDRDLVRVDIFASGPKADLALRTKYHVLPGQFRVLLIGKDGHVAFGGPTPISLQTLTSAIDRMPMRREEMRQKGELRQR